VQKADVKNEYTLLDYTGTTRCWGWRVEERLQPIWILQVVSLRPLAKANPV
jgi:hypothetical protein